MDDKWVIQNGIGAAEDIPLQQEEEEEANLNANQEWYDGLPIDNNAIEAMANMFLVQYPNLPGGGSESSSDSSSYSAMMAHPDNDPLQQENNQNFPPLEHATGTNGTSSPSIDLTHSSIEASGSQSEVQVIPLPASLRPVKDDNTDGNLSVDNENTISSELSNFTASNEVREQSQDLHDATEQDPHPPEGELEPADSEVVKPTSQLLPSTAEPYVRPIFLAQMGCFGSLLVVVCVLVIMMFFEGYLSQVYLIVACILFFIFIIMTVLLFIAACYYSDMDTHGRDAQGRE